MALRRSLTHRRNSKTMIIKNKTKTKELKAINVVGAEVDHIQGTMINSLIKKQLMGNDKEIKANRVNTVKLCIEDKAMSLLNQKARMALVKVTGVIQKHHIFKILRKLKQNKTI